MKSILIADDHEIIRRGIVLLLNDFPVKYKMIEADTCSNVLNILFKEHPDYLILDMNLADGNIFNNVQNIIELYPDTRILVYTMKSERLYAIRLLKIGVKGYVSKQSTLHELKEAIQKFLHDDMYLSPQLQEQLFLSSQSGIAEDPIESLSARELEVSEYIVTGLGSKEIASKMSLEITTVSTYRRRAFEKLGVQNMIELKEKFLIYGTSGHFMI
jgi:DNA-binding NarL/FixJ family response regulator